MDTTQNPERITTDTLASRTSTQIFISYARVDASEFVKELAVWLKQNGYMPWVDKSEHGIRGGE